ncbi:hypothetical protein ACFLYD_05255 [Chloroflexota bacterium]
MTDSIVVKRLIRNLRYKLTYVKIFETYLETESGSDVVDLLNSLIEAQQSAIAPLSSYLRGLGVSTQDLELNDKLMTQALSRDKLRVRLQFIYDGLSRSTSWYKTQLMDRQMTADPELRQLLLELGQIDAARLWHTEAIMGLLRVPAKMEEKRWDDVAQPSTKQEEDWRPGLVEDVGRPAWSGSQSRRWPRPSRYRPKG